MEIIVDSADKGRAILIYPPSLAEKKISEKVTNTKLYKCLNKDPSEDIYNNLMDLWKEGKVNTFVTEEEAKKVVGLTKNNQKSTASIYKPGETYFNPSLKIHKMSVDEIQPGCDPPARLITCLQDGVTSRSDIYIAEKWLKPLQTDFCLDIVQDSMDVLIWLDEMNQASEQNKKAYKPFTFDFAALYDSLTPDLVMKAIKYAIRVCRTQWTDKFVDWILQLINLSMSTGFGKFGNKWYKPATGIPTGGNISVQLANIAVFYALHMSLFSTPQMMKNIVSTVRFIDDGSGVFKGTRDEFVTWKSEMTKNLKKFNLTIKSEDWSVGINLGDMVHILDISFGFDENGNLITDLYRKDTDSRGYLHFTSCHPNHVFSGIVYSQALRIRRIINKQETFLLRLQELKEDFIAASYPVKLITNIFDKVKNVPRILEKKQNIMELRSDVILTSTYGRDKQLRQIVQETCKPYNIPVRCVNKTGTKLKNLVSNLK